MKPGITSLLLLLLPLWGRAQDYPGEYVLDADGGQVVFDIQDAGQHRLEGSLLDSDGTRYQVQAVVEGEFARGTLLNDRGGLYFEARLKGEQMVLTIMPADAYNQPDYLSAKDFFLTRREKVKAPIELSPIEQVKPEEEQWLPDQPAPGAAGEWAGNYNGVINEAPTQLSISRYGNQLSGEVDAGGYKYILEGAISEDKSWGEAYDPQTQGKMKFSGTLSGNVVMLDFFAEQGRFRVQFLRQGSRPLPGISESTGQNPAGNWVHAQPPASGEFSPPEQTLLQLHPDGTFHFGKAAAVRSNPNGRGVGRGRWKTEGNDILIDQGKGWIRFAAYFLKGDSLLLEFGKDNRQEWKRVD